MELLLLAIFSCFFMDVVRGIGETNPRLNDVLKKHEVSYSVTTVIREADYYVVDDELIISNLEQDKDLLGDEFSHISYHEEHIEISGPGELSCVQIGQVFLRKDFFKDKGMLRPVGRANLNLCDGGFKAHLDLINVHNQHSAEIKISEGSYNLMKDETSLSNNNFTASFYRDGDLKEHWSCGTHIDEHDVDEVEQYRLLTETLDEFLGAADSETKIKSNLRRNLFDVSSQSKTKYVKVLVVNDHARFLQKGGGTVGEAAHIIQRLQSLYDKLYNKYVSLYGAEDAYRIKVSIAGMITFKYSDAWASDLRAHYKSHYNVDIGQGSYTSSYSTSIDSHILLDFFAEWKRRQSVDRRFPEHSVGHLISGNEFDGATVGLANLFAVCRNQVSVAVNQAKGFQTETVATIMAHEMAHNLGVYHTDTTYKGSLVSSQCGGFIMDANGIRNTEWSKCTVNYMKMFFEGYPFGCTGQSCNYARRYGTNSLPSCLEEAPTNVWSTSSICGNGLKETGEQCDCGQDDCSEIDPCCDGRTCTFLSDDFECSDLDPCCDNCFIAPKEKYSEPCRPSKGVCDVAEYCDGQQSSCPYDQFKETGKTCHDTDTNAEGSCYVGNCNSHRAQCSEYRSLGYDGPCYGRDHNNGDKACGNLYCHPTGSPTTTCSQIYFNDDYVRVLDGTTCDKGLVCDSLKEKCVDPSSLAVPVSLSCSNGLLDTGETDVDCGGPRCNPCLPGDSCLQHADCFNNDCVNSSVTADHTKPPTLSLAEPEEGCTSVRNETSCDDWTGCIWLEEFTRCKRYGHLPPSGDCFSQKKRQSCINFERCEWDFEGDRCVEIVGESPIYGSCSGKFLAGEGTSWWSNRINELKDFLGGSEMLAYTVLISILFSLVLFTYAVVAFVADRMYLRKEIRKEKENRKKWRERNKRKAAERKLREKKNSESSSEASSCNNGKPLTENAAALGTSRSRKYESPRPSAPQGMLVDEGLNVKPPTDWVLTSTSPNKPTEQAATISKAEEQHDVEKGVVKLDPVIVEKQEQPRLEVSEGIQENATDVSLASANAQPSLDEKSFKTPMSKMNSPSPDQQGQPETNLPDGKWSSFFWA